MRLGLVLGGGGTVGLAYHAGVLRALERVAGVEPNSADLVVGTSAGSLVGAYIRSGWTTEDFWAFAMGTHSSLEGLSAEEMAANQAGIFAPLFRSPIDVLRRGLGSAFVVGSAVVRLPAPMPPFLARAFPGGFFNMEYGRSRFADDLPEEWPDKPLWLCAVDIVTGRRIVLGREGSPEATLHAGVLSSCAIPGLYQPVRLARMTLVDGGAHSPTNLDLASKAGCELIIASAPISYDPSKPPPPAIRLARQLPTRMLSAEAADARRRGANVLVIRPSASELRLHGVNLMRRSGWDVVARAAYDSTARTLETDRFKSALKDLVA